MKKYKKKKKKKKKKKFKKNVETNFDASNYELDRPLHK